MKYSLFFVVVCLSILVSQGHEWESGNQYHAWDRIAGGTDAELEEFPWQVSIEIGTPNFWGVYFLGVIDVEELSYTDLKTTCTDLQSDVLT